MRSDAVGYAWPSASAGRSVRRMLPRPKVSCEYSRTFGAGDAARCGFRSRSTMAAFIGLRMYVGASEFVGVGQRRPHGGEKRSRARTGGKRSRGMRRVRRASHVLTRRPAAAIAGVESRRVTRTVEVFATCPLRDVRGSKTSAVGYR